MMTFFKTQVFADINTIASKIDRESSIKLSSSVFLLSINDME